MAEFKIDVPMKAAIFIAQDAGTDDDNKIPVRINKIQVDPRSIVTKNTMANGKIYHDYKVIQPASITVDCALERRSPDYSKALEVIYNLYAKRWYKPGITKYDKEHAPFSMIRTKDGILWKNLVLESCPHSEDTEHFDVFMFQLVFKEFIIVNADGFKPLNTFTP